jgi:hypothetical protein
MMRFQPFFRPFAVALVTTLVAFALTAPIASAVPAEQFHGSQASQRACESHLTRACADQGLASSGTGVPTGEVSPRAAAPDIATDPGFDWGAAAIGAGTAVGLMGLAAMAVFVLPGRAPIRTAR